MAITLYAVVPTLLSVCLALIALHYSAGNVVGR